MNTQEENVPESELIEVEGVEAANRLEKTHKEKCRAVMMLRRKTITGETPAFVYRVWKN
jgi:hypothetical protein